MSGLRITIGHTDVLPWGEPVVQSLLKVLAAVHEQNIGEDPLVCITILNVHLFVWVAFLIYNFSRTAT